MAHDSRAVANQILEIAQSQGIDLTLMQLLKLVYLANGWWLIYSEGEPLTDTNAQVWQYGPVHPQVYKAFRKHGSSRIGSKAEDPRTGFPYSASFSEAEKSVMETIVQTYGRMHAFKLSDIMHRDGTPWTVTKDRSGLYSSIPNELIKEHFDGIRRESEVI